MEVKCKQCGEIMDNKECFNHHNGTNHSEFNVHKKQSVNYNDEKSIKNLSK